MVICITKNRGGPHTFMGASHKKTANWRIWEIIMGASHTFMGGPHKYLFTWGQTRTSWSRTNVIHN